MAIQAVESFVMPGSIIDVDDDDGFFSQPQKRRSRMSGGRVASVIFAVLLLVGFVCAIGYVRCLFDE